MRAWLFLFWLLKCAVLFAQDDYNIIFPGYCFCTDFHNGLAVISTNDGKKGYMNSAGEIVIEAIYDSADDFYEILAPVSIRKKLKNSEEVLSCYGLIDTKGRLVVEPKYAQISVFSEGLATVHEFNENGGIGKAGVLNTKGELVIPAIYDDIGAFEGGLAWYHLDSQKDNWWKSYGILNKNGEIVTDQLFSDIGPFKEGLAAARTYCETSVEITEIVAGSPASKLLKSGDIIEKIGEQKIHTYSELTTALSGFKAKDRVPITISRGHEILNVAVELVDRIALETLHNPEARMNDTIAEKHTAGYLGVAIKAHGKLLWGYVNTFGQFVIEPQFEEAKEFSEGLAPFAIEQKGDSAEIIGNLTKYWNWGLGDEDELDSLKLFYMDKFGLVKKWGFIDSKGTVIIEPISDRLDIFSEGIASVNIGDYWGGINRSGELVIPMKYKYVGQFKAGEASVLASTNPDGHDVQATTFVDIDDVTERILAPGIIELKINRLGEFIDGLLPFNSIKKGVVQWGFKNANGDTIIQPEYHMVTAFSEGLAGVQNEKKQWGFINEKGDQIIAPQFEAIRAFKEGLAAVKFFENGNYGYIDKAGNLVLAADLEAIDDGFANGFANVEFLQGRYTVISKDAAKKSAKPKIPVSKEVNPSAEPISTKPTQLRLTSSEPQVDSSKILILSNGDIQIVYSDGSTKTINEAQIRGREIASDAQKASPPSPPNALFPKKSDTNPNQQKWIEDLDKWVNYSLGDMLAIIEASVDDKDEVHRVLAKHEKGKSPYEKLNFRVDILKKITIAQKEKK